MPRADGLLVQGEVAEILSISRRHICNLVRQGRLLPVDRGFRGEDLFRAEEVYALLEMKNRRLDLADTANLAVQAHALSRSMLSRLDKLCQMFGLTVNRLSHDEDAVYHLHLKVRDTTATDLSELRTGALMEWASTLQAIDESYLRIVEEFTLDADPWSSYLVLANEIMRQRRANTTVDTNTVFAYNCVDSARKHLRHVSYFYIRIKHGADVADKAVTEADVDEEIIGQLYPGTVGPS